VKDYTVKKYDSQGNFVYWYDYLNRTYDSNGKLVSYDWVKRDENGNIIDSGHWSSS